MAQHRRPRSGAIDLHQPPPAAGTQNGPMTLTFLGAAGEVTGSCYLFDAAGRQVEL